MVKAWTVFGALIVASFIFQSCNSGDKTEQISDGKNSTEDSKMKSEEGLRAANDSLYAALNAMFTGNLEPMNNIWSHHADITDMGPFGGRLTGWEAVGAEFKKEAGMKLGGKVNYTDLHVYAGTDMGYTVCTEVGENMTADGKTVTVSHRATNIFHLENGQWKLVHHHTDLSPQLQEATSEEEE